MQYKYVVCPICNARLRYRSAGADKKVNCPGCHRVFFPHEATSTASGNSQDTSENIYDVKLRGKKLFSISVPRHLENALFTGVMALLLMLAVGGALLLGYRVASSNRSSFSRKDQSQVSIEANDTPRVDRIRTNSAINRSPVDLPKYEAVSTTPAHRYQFEKGQRFAYDVSLTANAKDRKYSLEGELSYEISPKVRVPEKAERVSGTAFVVDSNGILITCAHVVRDAAYIHVFLGKEVYNAEVVAFDRKSDLALLQIEASGLSALPLENTGEIRLAQQVRLIGYPLTGVLGSSVKISRGTVAGGVEDLGHGHNRFQVDASFNPGNSGGPLVDDSGAVVGVASAMLSGRKLSEVGIAIPVVEVNRLMSNLDLYPVYFGNGEPLSGPDLAEQVVKSVALVKVAPRKTAATRYRVDYQWRQTQADLPTTNTLNELPAALEFVLQDAKRFPESMVGSFDIDYLGRIFDYPNADYVPFCYEQIGKLAFEEFDGDRENHWTARFKGRLGNLPANPDAESAESLPSQSEKDVLEIDELGKQSFRSATESYNVADQLRYSVETKKLQSSRIAVQRSFFTLGEQEPPRLQLEANRRIEFDNESGLIHAAKFTGVTIENTRDETELRILYTLRLKLRVEH